MSRGLRRHRFWGRFGAIAGTFLILSTLMLSAGASVAIAADTGAKLPGATHSPDEWANPTNARSDTDSSAVATAQGDDDDQGFSSFGFGVPAGSIIDGITVQVRALTSDNDCRAPGLAFGRERIERDQHQDRHLHRRLVRHADLRRGERHVGPRLGSDAADERQFRRRPAARRAQWLQRHAKRALSTGSRSP